MSCSCSNNINGNSTVQFTGPWSNTSSCPTTNSPNKSTCQSLGYDSYDSSRLACYNSAAFSNPQSCNSGDGLLLTKNCGLETCNYCCLSTQTQCPNFVGSTSNPSAGWSGNGNLVGSLNYMCNYTLNNLVDVANNTIVAGIPSSFQNQCGMAQVYSYYCSLQVQNPNMGDICPADALTGLPMTSCSNMVAKPNATLLSNGYKSCQQFFAVGLGNNVQNGCYNASADIYCTNNPTAQDCSCINRASNQTYAALSAADPMLNTIPNCWWTPCQIAYANSSLIPRDVPVNKCPPDICKTILKNVGANGIDPTTMINIEQQCNVTINVPSNDGGNMPSVVTNNMTGTLPPSSITTVTSMSTGSNLSISRTLWIILLGGAGILVLVVIIVVISKFL